jgi:hypothetical protein
MMVSAVQRRSHLGYVLRPRLSPLVPAPRVVTVVQAQTQVASSQSATVANSGAWVWYCYLKQDRVAKLWLIRKPSIR